MRPRPPFSPLSALAALAAVLVACGPPPERQPVNLVLIVVDTLRQDHVGAYGYPRPVTPNLDRLAADGVRFANAYSQAPWTTPSVGALLTSHYPTELGITDAPHPLADRFLTLAEVLSQAGWTTGAVVSHYFLGSQWNFDQGFELFDESNVLGHAGVCSPGVTATASAFASAHRDEPFFLFAHYFDPHYDYIEHPEFRFSDPDYDGPVTSAMEYVELRDMGPQLTAADLDHLRALYDSEIAFTDHYVGELLDHLRQLGLYDDSLIVFTSDHGEEFMERSTIGHGGSLYNELIRVPLVIKYPGGAGAGRLVTTNVGLIDLYPTLLEVLGLPLEQAVSGHSLAAGRQPGEEPRPRPVFSETDWGFFRSLVGERFKLIHRLPQGPVAFFDLEADPGERQNLIARQAEFGVATDFERLEHRLDSWLAYLATSASRSEEVEISDEVERQLKALGYLD